MNWPQFEEYTEEFRDIAAGKVKKGPSPVGDDLPEHPSGSNGRQNGGSGSRRTDPRNGTTDSRTANNTNSNPPYRSEISNGGLSSTSNNERHFEEEEWDDNQ